MKQQIMNLLGKLGITTNTFDIIHVAIMILQELKICKTNISSKKNQCEQKQHRCYTTTKTTSILPKAM